MYRYVIFVISFLFYSTNPSKVSGFCLVYKGYIKGNIKFQLLDGDNDWCNIGGIRFGLVYKVCSYSEDWLYFFPIQTIHIVFYSLWRLMVFFYVVNYEIPTAVNLNERFFGRNVMLPLQSFVFTFPWYIKPYMLKRWHT